MLLGAVNGLTSNIVSPDRPKTPNHWTHTHKNPYDVMKEESDKFIKQREEESKAKPASERNIGDWFNVAMSGFRKFVEIGKNSVIY